MDLGGVLSATAHLISDSAAWRVPSESDANVDVARGTLPPARWTSGANVGPPPPPRVPTLAADVGRQGGRCTSHLTPPTLPRYLGKVLPCLYIRPLLPRQRTVTAALLLVVRLPRSATGLGASDGTLRLPRPLRLLCRHGSSPLDRDVRFTGPPGDSEFERRSLPVPAAFRRRPVGDGSAGE